MEHVRLLADRFDRYLAGVHESRRAAEALADTDTADLFTQVITELEKHAWFLRASLDV
jgi:starvation-inducible DNA-binding protein